MQKLVLAIGTRHLHGTFLLDEAVGPDGAAAVRASAQAGAARLAA